DHSVEARLAPAREEFRRIDAAQCRLAQRLLRLMPAPTGNIVHAGEPLRRRAIDDRSLMTPAMHVAVRKFLGMKQRADLADLVDDLPIGIPDLHAAKTPQAG